MMCMKENKTKAVIKTLMKLLVFMFILVLLLEAAGFATNRPNAYTRIMLHEMYKEEDIDLVFIGASRTYRGFAPYVIDEELGSKSFNMGSSAQGIVDTYYLLEEMYKYHSPEVVVICINHGGLYRRSNTRKSEILIDYYKPSFNKIMYMKSAFKPEDYPKALFPALRKGNRNIKTSLAPSLVLERLRTKLSSEYLDYSYSLVTYDDARYAGRGFVYSYESLGDNIGNIRNSMRWRPDNIDSARIEYIGKAVRLCKKNGSVPILVHMPPSFIYMERLAGYSGFQDCMDDIASSNGVDFFDFALIKRSVFERSNAQYNDSNHLNGEGAEEFSRVFSKFLSEYTDGTLEADNYLYSSYNELMQDLDYVLSTWLTWEDDHFEAVASCGTAIRPEFEFLYKADNDDGYTLLRPYGEDPVVPRVDAGGESYTLRVNARAVGSDDDYEQYDEMRIGAN